MKKVKSTKSGLKVLNDRVLVLPEKETKAEGATPEVIEALESKKLVLAEAYEAYYFKRPQWGKVVSWGDRCRYDWRTNQKVYFPRDGWAKLNYQGTEYLIFSESQLNATEP